MSNEDDQQQQQYPQQQYQAPPNAFETYNSSIVLLTNTDSQLHRLELTLRNCREDDQGNVLPITQIRLEKNPDTGEIEQIEEELPPLMNETGIVAMIGYVQSLASRHSIMNNWEEKRINFIMLQLAYEIITNLTMNRHRYGMQSVNPLTDKSYIVFQAVFTSYIIMKRGEDAGERVFLTKTVQEAKHIIENGQKKQGFFSKLPLVGGNK